MILLKIKVKRKLFNPTCVHSLDGICGLGWSCDQSQMCGVSHKCGCYKPKVDEIEHGERVYLLSTMGVLDNVKLNNYSMFLNPGDEIESVDIRKDSEIFKDSNCGVFQII